MVTTLFILDFLETMNLASNDACLEVFPYYRKHHRLHQILLVLAHLSPTNKKREVNQKYFNTENLT